ncbi:hypothetical protein [Massilibacteroides vaginae]|uniref:hypothetical protein n=1 Tax=Massilibacteroides vaginae TaxID=1673718 RepID=UPI000A1CB576|nr:hypothetical protein [Massilibacteroides vaginae]
MHNTVGLFIIYNHRYDKNIEKIEQLYKKSFSHIFHIMPFYDGDKENVLPVYASSYQFSSYIPQAMEQLKLKNISFDHYFFLADDMILNPKVTENTYKDLFKISLEDSFISEFVEFTKFNFYTWHGKEALTYKIKATGAEIDSFIPNKEEALLRFKNYGINFKNWKWYHFIPPIKVGIRPIIRLTSIWVNAFFRKGNLKLKYPLVGAFSDIVIISSKHMKTFSQYCGAFAADGLFVEYALPTSLLLTTNRIITLKNLEFEMGALWGKEMMQLNKYDQNLNNLLNNFPSQYLFVHPVKLSKWNYNG